MMPYKATQSQKSKSRICKIFHYFAYTSFHRFILLGFQLCLNPVYKEEWWSYRGMNLPRVKPNISFMNNSEPDYFEWCLWHEAWQLLQWPLWYLFRRDHHLNSQVPLFQNYLSKYQDHRQRKFKPHQQRLLLDPAPRHCMYCHYF